MTEPENPWFRKLFDEILKYGGHSLFKDVLTPWLEKAHSTITEFGRFRTFSHYDRFDEPARIALWNLYALSRVNDLLLMSFQVENEATGTSANLKPDEYATFFSQNGFTVIESDRFSPFHHEIVQVQQSQDDDEPVRVVGNLWPGLVLGDMLFSRSGVVVIGGRKYVVKEIAERSTLYFSYRRRHRKTNDLSMGWGSNSQWRTNHRRDYQSDGMWIYNADGKNLLNAQAISGPDGDGLTLEERVELCRNRCFISTSKQDQELWPFDDRYEEPCT